MVCAAMFAMLGGTMTSFAGEWKMDSKGYWYSKDDGEYAVSEWLEDNGKWYYIGDDGYMVSSTWVGDYYVGVDGAWVSDVEIENQNKQYLEAYAEFLYAYNVPKDRSFRFSLLYIDGDAIPELMISEGSGRMTQGVLYHYYQGQVQKLGSFGECGGVSYIPGANIFCDSTLSAGAYYSIYYTIQDNICIPLIRFDSYTAGNDYSINGFSVTEEMFNNQLMFWETNYPMTNSADYFNGYTLNEINIKNMMENAQNVIPKDNK